MFCLSLFKEEKKITNVYHAHSGCMRQVLLEKLELRRHLSDKQLGDCGTGSTYAQSSGGIYGNIEISAFGVGRSIQLVMFFFKPRIGIFPHPIFPPTRTLQWTNHAWSQLIPFLMHLSLNKCPLLFLVLPPS